MIEELEYLTSDISSHASGINGITAERESESHFHLWEENDRLKRQLFQLEKEKAQLTEENRRISRETLKKQGKID